MGGGKKISPSSRLIEVNEDDGGIEEGRVAEKEKELQGSELVFRKILFL